MSNTIFERCYEGPAGMPLTAKAELLDVLLRTEPPEYYDGLRMVLLEGVKPLTRVRMPNGKIREMLMLGSNSFLNLNYHPRMIEAERRAVERFGVGAGSPPLYAGQTELHEELEAVLAEFTGTEAALIFPAGYSGNLGVLSGLCRPGDKIFCDSSNHASLIDGARLSGTEIIPYRHLSVRHLAQMLASSAGKPGGRLIVSDGVFSMEGSLAPVDELADLAEEYGCMLMIDDAHGFWVMGEEGAGTAAYFGARDRVPLHYGTFSKALGTVGGFCAGSKTVIQYLKFYARSTFFSSALPTSVAATVLEGIRIVREEPGILQALKRNRDFFQEGLTKNGFNTLNSRSAIIPILIGNDDVLGKIQMELFDAGIFCNIGTTPAVNRKQCRLRLNVMATHSLEQLGGAVETISAIARKYRVIP